MIHCGTLAHLPITEVNTTLETCFLPGKWEKLLMEMHCNLQCQVSIRHMNLPHTVT